MVKVLIAHDRQEVLEKIKRVVLDQGVQASEVHTAEDGQTVRQKLSRELFDLAIFDLTLPAVRGKSEPGYSTAEDIFLEIYKGDGLSAPGDVIGISKVPEALARINTSIGPHLMTVIEETSGDEWQSQLADKVSYTIRAASGRLLAAGMRHDYDVAIVTALDKELAPFKSLFPFEEVDYFPGCFRFGFTDAKGALRRGVAFSVGSAGQAGCASATQSLIARFRPRAFFLSGFCGGYSEKAVEGEILLFRSVYDWDSGKWEPSKGASGASSKADDPPPVFLPRAEPLSIGNAEMDRVVRSFADQEIVDRALTERGLRELTNGEVTEVKVTPVLGASGSAVIADPSVLARIRKQHDKIVGVDMESYGFYRACTFTPFAKPEMLCVKSVADFCDGQKDDRLHAGCCYASAKVVEDIVLNRWRF